MHVASAGRSWWPALARDCSQDDCGDVASAATASERRGRRRRDSGPGRASRLMTLEVSAATSAVVEADLKLVATARRCLDVFLDALNASTTTRQRSLSKADLAIIVRHMEKLKHSTIEGMDATQLIGGELAMAINSSGLPQAQTTAQASGQAASTETHWSATDELIQLELFDLARDPFETNNLFARVDREEASTERGKTLQRLKAALRISQQRAILSFARRASDAPGLRFWFCAQSFKSSAAQWPLVKAHHTCEARSALEKSGEHGAVSAHIA